MPVAPTKRPESRWQRRKSAIVLLAVGVFLLLTIAFSLQAFNLKFLQPDTSGQTLVFAALSALVFVLLLTLSLVLARILLKVFAERRGGALGSKFRTRMVLAALALSLAPVLFLFLFAYGLMNRSIDKWFSTPVEEVRRDTATVGDLLASYATQNAQAEATSMASAPETQRAFESGNFGGVIAVFRLHQQPLQGGFALALLDGELEASFQAPTTWPVLKGRLGAEGSGKYVKDFQFRDTRYLVGTANVGERGVILVGMPLPPAFTSTMRQIEQSQQHYLELAKQRKMVRRTYMLLLLLITMAVLFAATWFAQFLSKLVTRPVVALAEATQQISQGNLDYRVEVPARDEFGALVTSFNRMAAELQGNRQKLEASRRELAEANAQLEQRREHIATVLENIPTGVLSLDANLRISHANRAFLHLFRPDGNGGAAAILLNAHIRELFPQDVIDDLAHMMRKANRMGTAASQMQIATGGHELNLAVTVASLKHGTQRLGYLLVFEDLSDLLKAQKQAAWREVAQRVAHEIKNPLTPISLSAQRIRRYLERGTALDDASLAVIHGCAETIAGAVDTVRTLVDEFATLARFPAAKLQPADINAIVESALAMFNGRLDDITVRTSYARDLPSIMLDADAFRRAIANLVDNAAEAMHGSLVREIQISTALVGNRDTVEIVVADTGHGVTAEVKEKLFLPYFSTKKRGTGLGLAIVNRIVEDHHGSIRVEENKPVDTRFVVELPIATEVTTEAATHA